VSPGSVAHRVRPGALITALQPWAEVGEPLHRRLLGFTDPEDGWEILWAGAGAARAATWWSTRRSGSGTAIDPDAHSVGWAQRVARGAGVGARVTLQPGRVDDLPYTEAVFDLVVTTLVFDPEPDPAAAIAQAVRVVRPLHPVVVAVPVWSGSPVESAEPALAGLGVRPRFLTAWKQVAREAGLVEISGETILRDGHWIARGTVGAVTRAVRTAGLDGARTALSGAVRTLRHLARRGALDLAMVRGVRWPAE